MPKERRTPEEIEEHYKQKSIRRAENAEAQYNYRRKRRLLARRHAAKRRLIARRRKEHAARCEARAKNRLIERRHREHAELREERAKARIKRRHNKGRYSWDKLSPEKKAELAEFSPWDL